MQQLWKNYRLF